MGLPGFQSVTTCEPNMYFSISSGSVRAVHTRFGGASISVSAVATKSAMRNLLVSFRPLPVGAPE
jgi:hypothetical protein